MTAFAQRGRLMSVRTPLGPDALLLERLAGAEAVSELFEFRLDLLAEPDTPVPFDRVLGQPVTVALPVGRAGVRHLTGLVSRFGQGEEVSGPRGGVTFVRYHATVVPPLWLLTRRSRSRIFQQKPVPDILKAVFAGLEVDWRLGGRYEPRDYCVQYRETDFAFASRLMEEEGIFYHFHHGDGEHRLVVADGPHGHDPVPVGADLLYDVVAGGNRPEDRVTGWAKYQEVRSGRQTLWDHCFELPGRNLEARATIQPEVAVGRVTHSLRVGGNDGLEVYDYPGGYAQRFDGVGPAGGDRAADVAKIFDDNQRTAKLRMQREASEGVAVEGASTCRQLTAGHAFSPARHFNADGEYVLTRVEHRASLRGAYGTGEDDEPGYGNTFRAVPKGLPYRPPAATPRARVYGTQTATVVGLPGEEIFTDKYGRVKVQFPWDRDGRNDADSSCWVRVSQVHAGRGFGGIDVPRVGEEVVVAFEEGDPDRPIVIGRVYNAAVMPPFELPGKRMVSGLKSNTYPGGGGSNEISLDDSQGAERMYVHAQYNQDTVVGNNRTAQVAVDDAEAVGNNQSVEVGANQAVKVGTNQTVDVGTDQTVSAGNNITITAGKKIVLQCGAANITMMQNGMITISGTVIAIAGMANCSMTAPMTNVTGAVLLTAAGAITRVHGGTLAQLKGNTVEVDGSTTIVSGNKVEVTASAELSAKGNPIKLN